MEIKNILKRRDLLPWWIKSFCWLFIITSFLLLIVAVLLYLGYKPELAIYGLDANDNYPINCIIVFIVFLLHGFTAYSLWFSRKHAIVIGLINAVFGIILCLYSMGLSLYNDNFTVRLEIVLLILFFIKLLKIKKEWNFPPTV